MSLPTYDVALSYAREQQEYVAKVANYLKSKGIRCFFDKGKDEEIMLWAKDLHKVLRQIFKDGRTSLVIVFISKDYINNDYSMLEFGFAQDKEDTQDEEYVIPVRFDCTVVKGLNPRKKYLTVKENTPEQLAEKIIKKLKAKENYKSHKTQDELYTTKQKDTDVTLTVLDESNKPISNVDAYLIHENGTHRKSTTNVEGKLFFEHDNNMSYTLFLAHKDYPACIVDDFSCANDSEQIVNKVEGTGSVIFPNSTGYIPGIDGRLNPILDSLERTYLYADYISINKNESQPTYFSFGDKIKLTDANLKVAEIKILRIIQRCTIIEYSTN